MLKVFKMEVPEAWFFKASDLLQPTTPNTNSKLSTAYTAEIWLLAMA